MKPKMNNYIRKLRKYIIVLIIETLFGYPWTYFLYLLNIDTLSNKNIQSVPNIADLFIKVIVIIFLVIDFKKENLKNIILTCIAAICYPLLGIVIFSILLIEKDKASA